MKVTLPYNDWQEREYQSALWNYLCEGGKRAIAIWHRRAGKDDIALHYAAIAMHERVGNVWHCLPEYSQGRKALWTAVNAHTGKRRIDEAFPIELRESTNDNEMFIRFKNQSTWQIIGSDQFDRTVGSSPMGIVYSEWALANPSAWAYHRPIIEENNGWSLFITTPRGRNHAHAMFNHATQSSDWFAELLTAEDTNALSQAQLAGALAEYQAIYGHDAGEAFFRQEFFCDFAAALLGAFFAYEMAQVRREERVLSIEPPPGALVHRAWDLGMRDDTSIWFFVPVGGQIYLLDCLSTSGASLEWWRDEIDKVHRERGWLHGSDFVPHDAKVRELGTGRTRVETMKSLGLSPVPAPDASLLDGINAARRTLPLCVFHPRCEVKGLPALEQYRREWDDEKKCFRQQPLHDWTSDRADAFRYLAMSWRLAPLRQVKAPKLEGGYHDNSWHIPPPSEPRRGIRL